MSYEEVRTHTLGLACETVMALTLDEQEQAVSALGAVISELDMLEPYERQMFITNLAAMVLDLIPVADDDPANLADAAATYIQDFRVHANG